MSVLPSGDQRAIFHIESICLRNESYMWLWQVNPLIRPYVHFTTSHPLFFNPRCRRRDRLLVWTRNEGAALAGRSTAHREGPGTKVLRRLDGAQRIESLPPSWCRKKRKWQVSKQTSWPNGIQAAGRDMIGPMKFVKCQKMTMFNTSVSVLCCILL